jgi:four helix bundle protein
MKSSYRDLEIYQESKQLAVAIHALSLTLPKFELYEEGSQLRRASKAVTSAIVESYGRKRYKADYIKHLIYALAECDETVLHLDFVFETGSLTKEPDYRRLRAAYDLLSKKINKFIQWLDGSE